VDKSKLCLSTSRGLLIRVEGLCLRPEIHLAQHKHTTRRLGNDAIHHSWAAADTFTPLVPVPAIHRKPVFARFPIQRELLGAHLASDGNYQFTENEISLHKLRRNGMTGSAASP
jgi:hypothetical protein